MYRVYKDFLRRVLLISLHYRDLGYTFKNSQSYAHDYWYKSRRSGNCPADEYQRYRNLLVFLETGEFDYTAQPMGDMIEQVVKQLEGSGENRDRDLVDTIVRVLNLPHARNILSGSTLQMIRSAILLPDELVALKAQLKDGMACMACGHKILSGEMTVYHSQGESSGFYCSRCQKPAYVASETDAGKSVPVASVKGLLAALKRKPDGEEAKAAVDPASVLEAASEVLGASSTSFYDTVVRAAAAQRAPRRQVVTSAPQATPDGGVYTRVSFSPILDNNGSPWDNPFLSNNAPTPTTGDDQ